MKKKRYTGTIFLFPIVLALVAGTTRADVVYHELFTQEVTGTTDTLPEHGWASHEGSNGAIWTYPSIGAYGTAWDGGPLNSFPLNSTEGDPGFLYAYAHTGKDSFFHTSEYSFDMANWKNLKFSMRHNSTRADDVRAAIEVDGSWYVSDAVTIQANAGWAGALLWEIEAATTTWHALAFTPGTTMAIGASTNLPSTGTVDGLGFYVDAQAAGSIRYDNFMVSGDAVVQEFSTVYQELWSNGSGVQDQFDDQAYGWRQYAWHGGTTWKGLATDCNVAIAGGGSIPQGGSAHSDPLYADGTVGYLYSYAWTGTSREQILFQDEYSMDVADLPNLSFSWNYYNDLPNQNYRALVAVAPVDFGSGWDIDDVDWYATDIAVASGEDAWFPIEIDLGTASWYNVNVVEGSDISVGSATNAPASGVIVGCGIYVDTKTGTHRFDSFSVKNSNVSLSPIYQELFAYSTTQSLPDSGNLYGWRWAGWNGIFRNGDNSSDTKIETPVGDTEVPGGGSVDSNPLVADGDPWEGFVYSSRYNNDAEILFSEEKTLPLSVLGDLVVRWKYKFDSLNETCRALIAVSPAPLAEGWLYRDVDWYVSGTLSTTNNSEWSPISFNLGTTDWFHAKVNNHENSKYGAVEIAVENAAPKPLLGAYIVGFGIYAEDKQGIQRFDNFAVLAPASVFPAGPSGFLFQLTEKKYDIPAKNFAINHQGLWPNLTTLPDGTIIATIFNQPSHLAQPGDTDCWASEDDGATWAYRGRPAPRGDPDYARGNTSAGLAANGDLIVITGGWADPGSFTTLLTPILSRSSDGGSNWTISTTSTAFPDESGYMGNPYGDIVQGENGNLFAAMYSGNPGATRIFRSTDDGYTWYEYSHINRSVVVNEPALLHLGDGHWLCASRTYNSGLDLYVSFDNALTWSRRGKLSNTLQHPGHLAQLDSGRILLTYGNRNDPEGVDARVSDDDGLTWSPPVRMGGFETWDGGYPSSVQLPDGQVLTAFYEKFSIPWHDDDYRMSSVIWNPAKVHFTW